MEPINYVCFYCGDDATFEVDYSAPSYGACCCFTCDEHVSMAAEDHPDSLILELWQL